MASFSRLSALISSVSGAIIRHISRPQRSGWRMRASMRRASRSTSSAGQRRRGVPAGFGGGGSRLGSAMLRPLDFEVVQKGSGRGTAALRPLPHQTTDCAEPPPTAKDAKDAKRSVFVQFVKFVVKRARPDQTTNRTNSTKRFFFRVVSRLSRPVGGVGSLRSVFYGIQHVKQRIQVGCGSSGSASGETGR